MEDYNDNVKSEINKLVEDYKISNEKYNALKKVLLKNDNQKATKRFIDFSMTYVNDDFFREEAINSKTPLKKSDLKYVLKNCYNIRSSYVHNLEKIKKNNYIISMMGDKETLGDESYLFLTFTGLTRLVHHILKNFIFSSEETGFEEIDFVEEIPHLANVTLAPQYWITDEKKFIPRDIFVYYHYFLTLLIPQYKKEYFLKFKGLIHRIEENLNNGVKKDFKDATLIFYYLCNKLYDKNNGISEKFNQTCDKYNINLVLDKLSIETLICKLILDENIQCDFREIINCYDKYVKNKFRKNALNLPDFYENWIVIVICKSFYHDNHEKFTEWANKLILELPSKVNCQNYIQNCINENKDIEFEEFKELYFNTNENG